MRRGEVWWLQDPRRKRRPACVLTRDEAIGVLTDIIVAPATTTVRGIRTEVTLDPDDGMPTQCVLSLDNVGAVPRELLTERITTLSPARMHEVCRALAVATGC